MWLSQSRAEEWLKYMGWEPSNSLVDWEKRNRYLLTKNGKPNILDDGGAHGRKAIYLASLGFYDIYLADVNVYSLRIGKEKLVDKIEDGKKRIEFIRENSIYHPFQNSVFDAVISFGLTHWLNNLEEIEQYLLDCRRILKPQGLLFGMTFKEWENMPKGLPRYPIFMDKETLKNLIQNSEFDIIKIYEKRKEDKIGWFFETKK